ncbi:MAG: hypothetical protein V7708_02825 [Oceanicoccus sp.]
MKDENAQGKVRNEAARELLDRGFGRSVGMDIVATMGGESAKNALPADLSDTAILELLQNGGALAPPSAAEAVEGEYTEIPAQNTRPSQRHTEPLTDPQETPQNATNRRVGRRQKTGGSE